MAAPNLLSPQTITGKTVAATLTTTPTDILTNAAASGKLLKVNIVRAANFGVSSQTTVTVLFRRSSTNYNVIDEGVVSVGSSLVILDRNEYIYLEEGDSIRASASANSNIDLLIHYEEIS